MTDRKPKKVYPTMKIDADSDNELDLEFKECQAEVLSVQDVETKKFGKKTTITLQEGKLIFNVFMNNYTNEQLAEAWGEDDSKWLHKLVDLKKEKDKQFNNDMIVLYPVK